MDALARPSAVLVMGVSGSGKSTLARALADALGRRFVEADDLHSETSRAKMAAGHPLDEADRAPWLTRVAEAGARQPSVIACSALRAAHRDRLEAVLGPLAVVFLTGPTEVLTARLRARTGHFMPAALLPSQLATLEPPAGPDVLSLPVTLSPDAQRERALSFLDARLSRSGPHQASAAR